MIEFGYALIPYIDPAQGGKLIEMITGLIRQYAKDIGLIVPPIRLRDNVVDLSSSEYSVKLFGTDVAKGEIKPNKLMALDTGNVKERISGDEFSEPAYGRPAVWIHENDRRPACREPAGRSPRLRGVAHGSTDQALRWHGWLVTLPPCRSWQ